MLFGSAGHGANREAIVRLIVRWEIAMLIVMLAIVRSLMVRLIDFGL